MDIPLPALTGDIALTSYQQEGHHQSHAFVSSRGLYVANLDRAKIQAPRQNHSGHPRMSSQASATGRLPPGSPPKWVQK